MFRGAAHRVDQRGALLVRGRNVEQHDLISARLAVSGSQLRGIARVAQLLELDAFYNAAPGDVEAGDDPFCERQGLQNVSRRARPTAPDFSG